MLPEDAVRATRTMGEYASLIAGLMPVAILAALGAVVRSIQARRCGLKAVGVAAAGGGFVGVLVGLLLDQTDLPMGVKAFLVGSGGYASGELLKIFMVRACRWAERAVPGGK
ncbi:hypothetical protein SAMN04488503_2233 [Humidesulfovibrio mexicanus]|uniref:Uncharacterized protein n=1 Tax=Humidesulfovibrio mexicanus TaxID=147047 RepID=A0A239AUN7_9BACT|nr:hypothetical protein [Humidesulfovibrio mexicanus]SNR99327.1 hypothetical protein SAMN04488503_2233 [Humidesulfovibrio mexicanus]